MNSDSPQNDHDLLITLHAEMRGIRTDIKEIKDNFAARVVSLEKRVAWLERIAYVGMTLIGGVQFYYQYLKMH